MLGGLKYSWWVESALRRLRLHWSDRGTCLNNQNNFVGHQTATGDHLFSKTRVLRFRESHYLATLASVFRQQIRRDFLHQFSVLNFLKAGQFGSYIIPVFEAAFEQDKKVSGVRSQFGKLHKLPWSSSGPEGKFQALPFRSCFNPFWVTERATALDTVLQRVGFFFCYRVVHAVDPISKPLDWPS